MIVDPEQPARRRPFGAPDWQRPERAAPGGAVSDSAAPDEGEPDWGDPFASYATLTDRAALPVDVRAEVDASGAWRGGTLSEDEATPSPAVPELGVAPGPGVRTRRPLLLTVMRPWFDPRPGESRGVIVLLAVSLAVSLALWFDATRRPSLDALPSPAGPVGVAPLAVAGTGPPGSADGSDGWGMDAGVSVPIGPVVHVSGAVRDPGVVTLPEGSRVADAVEASGGAMPDARLDRLNLARRVEDGERIHVMRVGEDAPPPEEAASRGVLPDGRIDLNAASQAELETLPGVGPARAQAIIAERDTRPFRVPGDLRRVPGIGEATFQRLAPLVVVR